MKGHRHTRFSALYYSIQVKDYFLRILLPYLSNNEHALMLRVVFIAEIRSS